MTEKQLPQTGDALKVGECTYTVRRVEEVHGYGHKMGHRVYFDLNGRTVYSPMTFSEWRTLAATAKREQEVEEAYAAEGFFKTGTGGNCTAMQMDLDADGYILVTRPNDPMMPTTAKAKVAVGRYDAEGDERGKVFYAKGVHEVVDGIIRRGWVSAARAAERVGDKFVELLRAEVGEAAFAEIAWRNLDDEDAHGNGVCHSHDFCDANMVMLAAYAEVFGVQQIDVDADKSLDTFNAAWAYAKSNFGGLIAPEGTKSPLDALVDEYVAWVEQNGYPRMSADELLVGVLFEEAPENRSEKVKADAAYIEQFIQRYEAAQRAHDKGL